MRTKLVIGAAVLAASLVTTMAQVYSLNIVGYCNVPAPIGYTFMSNPLDNGNNDANTLFPNPNATQGGSYSGPWDLSNLQTWNGTAWDIAYFDSETSDTTTGFVNVKTQPVPAPVLGSGKGFLLNNGNVSNLVTFVGNVRTGTNTMNLSPQAQLRSIGSMLPLAGGIVAALGIANPNATQGGSYAGPLDYANLQFLKVNPSGQSAGYNVVYFDSETSDTTTGFVDVKTQPVAEPQIGIGQGWIFANGGSVPYTWTQILNP